MNRPRILLDIAEAAVYKRQYCRLAMQVLAQDDLSDYSWLKPHFVRQSSVHSYSEITHVHFSSHLFGQMHPN